MQQRAVSPLGRSNCSAISAITASAALAPSSILSARPRPKLRQAGAIDALGTHLTQHSRSPRGLHHLGVEAIGAATMNGALATARRSHRGGGGRIGRDSRCPIPTRAKASASARKGRA